MFCHGFPYRPDQSTGNQKKKMVCQHKTPSGREISAVFPSQRKKKTAMVADHGGRVKWVNEPFPCACVRANFFSFFLLRIRIHHISSNWCFVMTDRVSFWFPIVFFDRNYIPWQKVILWFMFHPSRVTFWLVTRAWARVKIMFCHEINIWQQKWIGNEKLARSAISKHETGPRSTVCILLKKTAKMVSDHGVVHPLDPRGVVIDHFLCFF